jgi:DNA repair exonuclease SbcCD ATPase subunit
LELSEFKGLTGKWEFADGRNVFLGENGTGKTTLCDAEHWVRTGKNSHESAKFDIKPIVDGQPVSKSSHSVIAVYEIDGEKLTLERVYAEKWAKTRGKTQAEFTGHITTYRVNKAAKTTKKDFDAKIQEIFGGEQFKLCSDLNYFANLKWERRRAILSEMAGEIDREKLIDQIVGLKKALDGLTIEEKADVAQEKKRNINEELKTLPAVIAEYKTKILPSSEKSLDEAKKDIDQKKCNVRQAQKAIDEFKDGVNSDTATIEKIQSLNQDIRAETASFEAKKNEVLKTYNFKKQRVTDIYKEIKSKNSISEINQKEMENLREAWTKTNASVFEEKGNECNYCGETITCPHCDQKDEELEAQFNLKKSKELARINELGKSRSASNKLIAEKIAKLEAEKEEIGIIEEPPILSMDESEEITQLKAKIKVLTDKKEDVKVPQNLLDGLQDCETKLEEARILLAEIDANAKNIERLGELEERLSDLSTEFDQNEKFLFLLDVYNKKLAQATEGPVNQIFGYVRFRMFNQQVNSAIIPACDIMNDEFRPFETAMSAGEKIRAALDILKTMSEHHQIQAPVFIDGAESITNIPELDCQTIELRASKEHSKLTQICL